VQSPISKSARRRNDLYAFFFQWPTERHGAVSAVVAGSVAGGLLTFGVLLTFVRTLVFQGWVSPNCALLLGAAGIAACATWATWKHFLVGPIVALTMGVPAIGWVVIHHHDDPGIALIVAIPFIGGCVTGARGTMVLNQLARARVGRN